MAVPVTVLSPVLFIPQPPSRLALDARYDLSSVATWSGISVSVTNHAMMMGAQNAMGPPLSHPQCPVGNCNFSKNVSALCAAAGWEVSTIAISLLRSFSNGARPGGRKNCNTKSNPRKYLSA